MFNYLTKVLYLKKMSHDKNMTAESNRFINSIQKYTFYCSFFLILILSFFSNRLHAETFEAGKDYEMLSTNKSNSGNKGSPQVIEFFSYGCPWCFKLEPTLEQWLNQHRTSINFQRVPVIFNPDWEYYARAYYTAKALSMDSQLTPPLFNAVLKEKMTLTSNQAMIDFFKAHGADPAIVESAFEHSPSMDMQIAEAQKQMADYQIRAIPAFVINGRFMTNLQLAKTPERLFNIINYLVNVP